jgi:hypothetical protein
MIDATRILDMLVGGGQGGSQGANQGANSPFGEPSNQMPARYDTPQPQHLQGGAPDLMARARDMLGGVTVHSPAASAAA